MSEAKRSTTAKLIVTVKPVDANPPEVLVSAQEGFVDENSPVGTNVVDEKGEPVLFTVNDKDFVSSSWKSVSGIAFIDPLTTNIQDIRKNIEKGSKHKILFTYFGNLHSARRC